VLHAQGAFQWTEFSSRLAGEIAAHAPPSSDSLFPLEPDVHGEYYERWLSALERLLLEKGLLAAAEIEERAAEIASGHWDHHDGS
jgi:hypothetical protein